MCVGILPSQVELLIFHVDPIQTFESLDFVLVWVSGDDNLSSITILKILTTPHGCSRPPPCSTASQTPHSTLSHSFFIQLRLPLLK